MAVQSYQDFTQLSVWHFLASVIGISYLLIVLKVVKTIDNVVCLDSAVVSYRNIVASFLMFLFFHIGTFLNAYISFNDATSNAASNFFMLQIMLTISYISFNSLYESLTNNGVWRVFTKHNKK
ncbi:MAG: hypothetical protein FWG63_00315 [Defluviitaleaceae bacterium]|nr:hypothetical protein [Defluviitaleaceae bacterium]